MLVDGTDSALRGVPHAATAYARSEGPVARAASPFRLTGQFFRVMLTPEFLSTIDLSAHNRYSQSRHAGYVSPEFLPVPAPASIELATYFRPAIVPTTHAVW